jgi:hypothetical protein
MTVQSTSGSINNFLSDLTDDDALQILALAMAANDLTSCHKALRSSPEHEQIYFFALSILRELAKVVSDISKNFNRAASRDTQNILAKLSSTLTQFDDDSLVRSVLKPVRDMTFHYSYKNVGNDSFALTQTAVAEVKSKESLSVSFDTSNSGLLENRYEFADEFRANLINQRLSTDLVAQISKTAVDVMELVDSLVHDLSCKTNSPSGV